MYLNKFHVVSKLVPVITSTTISTKTTNIGFKTTSLGLIGMSIGGIVSVAVLFLITYFVVAKVRARSSRSKIRTHDKALNREDIHMDSFDGEQQLEWL